MIKERNATFGAHLTFFNIEFVSNSVELTLVSSSDLFSTSCDKEQYESGLRIGNVVKKEKVFVRDSTMKTVEMRVANISLVKLVKNLTTIDPSNPAIKSPMIKVQMLIQTLQGRNSTS